LREFWAKVDKTGTYRGQCSELCGKEHGFMPVVVNVVPQAEFAMPGWLQPRKHGCRRQTAPKWLLRLTRKLF
jgi:cytochrome c oxidase subunit 2